MRKILKRVLLCGLFVTLCWSIMLIEDRKKLDHGLIRFHIVAHSDSEEDQAIKMRIRDVVLESIQTDIQKIKDVEQAKEYLTENIPRIQQLVDKTLEEIGFQGRSNITLCKERFDIRQYDTFSLPAGVYNSLRIVIGDGMGKNWWCVSFPSLCIPATVSGFEDAAVGAGFSQPLVQSLSGDIDYKIHFFFLNQLGHLENILFQE